MWFYHLATPYFADPSALLLIPPPHIHTHPHHTATHCCRSRLFGLHEARKALTAGVFHADLYSAAKFLFSPTFSLFAPFRPLRCYRVAVNITTKAEGSSIRSSNRDTKHLRVFLLSTSSLENLLLLAFQSLSPGLYSPPPNKCATVLRTTTDRDIASSG